MNHITRLFAVSVNTKRGRRARARLRHLSLFVAGILFISLLAPDGISATAIPEVPITLQNFQLTGDLSGDQASFTLTATAKVEDRRGASIDLLSGALAITSSEFNPKIQLAASHDRYTLKFPHRGEFPIRVQFIASVNQRDGWKRINFHVAPAIAQQVVLRGLGPQTQFESNSTARPERKGSDFVTYLPSDGAMSLSWKEARQEAEGRLFFSAEEFTQVTVSPGSLGQTAILHFKVMQGELNRVTLRLHGAGEITRVQGDQVLAWTVGPIPDSPDRRLEIQLNQPQKDQFLFSVQAQTPLGPFPQTVDALRIAPENATSFSGFARIVNEGAVRLEVTPSGGATQISPEQFPESGATQSAFHAGGNQVFAYRFAGADFSFRVQADQILPELSASEILAYRLGENELAIEAEIELEIREAPLRELTLRVPKEYAVARLTAGSLNDYFLTEPPGEPQAELRLVFGQPLSGRQLIQLRLERNQNLSATWPGGQVTPMQETNWVLPRIDVARASAVRGYVGLASDPGFRLTAQRVKSVTEIPVAFYPGKLPNIQTAFRVTDAAWSATVAVERLSQTVQADVLHLFSIGEGIAYGSSVINYAISGAPMGSFRIELSNEFENAEFIGKDIRSWQKTSSGYVVQLQTPVSGPYTLLATYEKPFKPRGATLAFTGARPLDATPERGYTLITSAYQFQVQPTLVSSNLVPLEVGEVPPEYRLFSDAPVLAAWRYEARPFNLTISLNPLAQGDSLNQIVDRASLETRISREGQAVTDVRYFIKNRGNPHFRLTVPAGQTLWQASVNGTAVVPVFDGTSTLIPLPQSADPNAALQLDLKLASHAADSGRIHLQAPLVEAPVMLAQWKLEPDTGRRLVFMGGSVIPETGVEDASGFAQLARLLAGKSWRQSQIFPPSDVTLQAPVQEPSSMLQVEVQNISGKTSLMDVLGWIWPALFAVPAFALGAAVARPWIRFVCRVAGWTLLAWAALRTPNGVSPFIWVCLAFLIWNAGLPAVRRIRQWSRIPATAATLLAIACWSQCSRANASSITNLPQSVAQTIRVDGQFVTGAATIRWQAAEGQHLGVLSSNAILTRISYPPGALEVIPGANGQELAARKNGIFEITLDYEMRVAGDKSEAGFALPTPPGLSQTVTLTVANLDVDVASPQAVAVHRNYNASNTIANIVLTPDSASISWKPRHRDVASEKSVYYADISQLFVPSPGLIEGAHFVSIRPAQGEINELILHAPSGATITDVSDFSRVAPLVALWRFDPDSRQLRITLKHPQSRPFNLLVRSQTAAGPLPFERSVGLLSVENAASQIGLAAIATGSEVQLDTATAPGFSAINLEDFPGETIDALKAKIPGLTVRRAFRYSDPRGAITLKASAVEPDVRVESQNTLSLGEDRALLAATLTVNITRAGVFDLSFPMPVAFDVESISGSALSQWTESKGDAGRIITLHLNGKTLGTQTFAITLAGPGVKTARNWVAPQIVLREATKQQGTLLMVPEQGMRLQVASREGFAQLDPQASGVRQKGALAFRQLQSSARISLDIEQVDPWVQVTGWQHAVVSEARIKVTGTFDYQIENTGLKSFRLLLPTNATSVQFSGDQVGDFMPETGAVTNEMQPWSVVMRRRIIGRYLLHVTYQTLLAPAATHAELRGIQTANVNLQRGFVTVQSDPRLETSVDSLPSGLQPAEWQSIPGELTKELPHAAGNLTCRLVEPAFTLSLKLTRHEVARLLPARINNVAFDSVISDDAMLLTRARLEIYPGDKRLLSVTLPAGARFWFAFVNDNGVWPWRDGKQILIPLEQQAAENKRTSLEIYYACRAGDATIQSLRAELEAPRFDLPLENITWRISMGEKWKLEHHDGAFQFQGTELTPPPASDAGQYLARERDLQQERKKEAEELLALGNDSLAKGAPQQARRAFQAAYGLSTADAAFNEDARVQLHNIKLQEALIGLNARQSGVAGDTGALGGKLRSLRNRQDLNYTQQDAKDIIDINSADDNAMFMRLAEKLIQQQDAAAGAPASIRASIPEQGQWLTFHRTVAVDPLADLKIGLQASATPGASAGTRFLMLATLCLAFAVLAAGFSSLNRSKPA